MSISKEKKDIYSILNIPDKKSQHKYEGIDTQWSVNSNDSNSEEFNPNTPSGSIFDNYNNYPPEPDNYWQKFRITTIIGIITVVAPILWLGISRLIDFRSHESPQYLSEETVEEWENDAVAEEPVESISQAKGLPIKAMAAGYYPDYTIKTDYNWIEAAVPEIDSADGIILNGYGHINNSDISVNVILLDNGQIVGRYHHSNGTKLDLNGYVDPSSGNLYIKLGHAYDSTESQWTLWPISTDKERGVYVYEGEWGKNNKPSMLTLSY